MRYNVLLKRQIHNLTGFIDGSRDKVLWIRLYKYKWKMVFIFGRGCIKVWARATQEIGVPTDSNIPKYKYTSLYVNTVLNCILRNLYIHVIEKNFYK